MWGTISSDGRIFTSNADQKSWSIANIDSVKGHEGSKVNLKGRIDLDKNEIQVLSVKTASGKAEAAGKK